jgi:hypothetical protein
MNFSYLLSVLVAFTFGISAIAAPVADPNAAPMKKEDGDQVCP